jgi:HEAT repeat protein
MAAARQLEQRLREAGIPIQSLDDFERGIPTEMYQRAIPVLIEALRDPDLLPIKVWIIEALGVKFAHAQVVPVLLEEFQRIEVPQDMSAVPDGDELWRRYEEKVKIADVLGRRADRRVLPQIIALLQDKRHGDARFPLIDALVRLKPPNAAEVLLPLLADEQLTQSVIRALGLLRIREAAPLIRPFLEHPDRLMRTVAREALQRIEQAE